MSKSQTGESSMPRFEFRSFGTQFEQMRRRMEKLSEPVPEAVRERKSEEFYIVSQENDSHNVKIRGGKLDIKSLIQTVDGLEQWEPAMKSEFPIERTVLAEQVIPALQVEMTLPPDEQFTQQAFLDLVRDHPELTAVNVHKQRFGYMVHGTICEYAVVIINGTQVSTICSESTDRGAVHRTLADVGLAGLENINYLQAIKRVIGLIDKPLVYGPQSNRRK